MACHVTSLSNKRAIEDSSPLSIKRPCSNNRNNTIGGVYTTRNMTPPGGDDHTDSEDDWAFYGVSKRPALLPPMSPPAVDSDDDEERQNDYVYDQQQKLASYASLKSVKSSSSLVSRQNGGYKRRRRVLSVPESDITARARCFEYLVGAIDEVWAQYCDCTSSAEVQMYGGDLPCSPVSLYDGLAVSDNEDGQANTEEDGPASGVERGIQLMNLKKRLLNAKYFFSELLENRSWDACAQFWDRWDLVKYSTVDLVEDTDDDEVVDHVCEEIEAGRAYRGC